MLVGGGGKDVLVGGPGADTCAAGKGDVKVRCGKGPPCEAGSLTSPAQAVTIPAGKTVVAWFTTPIPNHFYYFHRGFDSGGCNDENDKLVANLEVYGSGGKLVAYTYDDPPAGRDRVESGRDCPVQIEDSEYKTCDIFRPDLSFNAKDANDVKTYSVAVSVQNRHPKNESTTATLTVKASWRPK